MSEVTVRDLRNHGGRILERVLGGEQLTITRDGRPIAQLCPLPRHPVSAEALLGRWRRLPSVDAARLRADLDRLADPSL